jgi:hypothetical protein
MMDAAFSSCTSGAAAELDFVLVVDLKSTYST